jgi:DNA-binding NarL/FixJ family response regulator
MINDALEATGLQVLLALDGKQALVIAERMHPHVILMDAIMPNMSGFEACRQLKSNPLLADVPVIFMTGLSDTPSIVEGLDSGGVDFLTKPINAEELIARMRVHLHNARRTQSVQSALELTGQLLFAVNRQFELEWTTEGVRDLLASRGLTCQDARATMAAPVQHWLDHAPAPGQTLRVPLLDLEVQLIDGASDAECVFRLLDPRATPSPDVLQAALPVTQRESQVLYWIAQGKTNREISEILGMSPRTVNKHLETIFPKLEVENRTSAAAVAIRALHEVCVI